MSFSAFQSLTAPRLNQDVLRLIFEELIYAWERSSQWPFHLSNKHFRVLHRLVCSVMLVCKLWREAALGTPRMWNHILLPWWRTASNRASSYFKQSTCLERSGMLPLKLYAAQDYAESELNTILSSLDKRHKRSPVRLSSLTLPFGIRWITRRTRFSPRARRRLSTVRHLTVYPANWYIVWYWMALVARFLCFFPNLHTLTVSRAQFRANRPTLRQVRGTLTQLTELSISGTLSAVWRVLLVLDCPVLKTLRVCIVKQREVSVWPSGVQNIPTVTTLAVCGQITSPIIESLFDKAPNVVSLHIHDIVFTERPRYSATRRFAMAIREGKKGRFLQMISATNHAGVFAWMTSILRERWCLQERTHLTA